MSLADRIREAGELFRDAFSQWREHNAFQLAAALAYYTIFSFTPLLTIAIAIAAVAFGRDAAQNQIVAGLSDLVGSSSAKAIQATIQAASSEQKGGTAAIIGAAVLLLGAAGVVGQLQQSLNFIWGVKAILASFQKYLPELYEAFEEIRPLMNTADEKRVITQVYAQTKNISIDYGVMEKADKY